MSEATALRDLPPVERTCERCGAALTKRTQKRFCSRGCALAYFKPPLEGKTNPRFNGGLCFAKDLGRWLICCRDGSSVYYARALMEAHLRRPLTSAELVHHLNGDPTDDRIENLQVVSRAEHIQIHRADLERAKAAA